LVLRDNWQKEQNLSREGLNIIKDDTLNKGLKRVCDFWYQSREERKWRIWRVPEYNVETPLKAQAKVLEKILEKR